MFRLELALLTHLGEAVAAIDGTVRLGLEGHLGLAAAGSADSGEVLTGATGRVLAGITAGLAALGLVLEAALGIELLLTGEMCIRDRYRPVKNSASVRLGTITSATPMRRRIFSTVSSVTPLYLSLIHICRHPGPDDPGEQL